MYVRNILFIMGSDCVYKSIKSIRQGVDYHTSIGALTDGCKSGNFRLLLFHQTVMVLCLEAGGIASFAGYSRIFVVRSGVPIDIYISSQRYERTAETRLLGCSICDGGIVG